MQGAHQAVNPEEANTPGANQPAVPNQGDEQAVENPVVDAAIDDNGGNDAEDDDD